MASSYFFGDITLIFSGMWLAQPLLSEMELS